MSRYYPAENGRRTSDQHSRPPPGFENAGQERYPSPGLSLPNGASLNNHTVQASGNNTVLPPIASLTGITRRPPRNVDILQLSPFRRKSTLAQYDAPLEGTLPSPLSASGRASRDHLRESYSSTRLSICTSLDSPYSVSSQRSGTHETMGEALTPSLSLPTQPTVGVTEPSLFRRAHSTGSGLPLSSLLNGPAVTSGRVTGCPPDASASFLPNQRLTKTEKLQESRHASDSSSNGPDVERRPPPGFWRAPGAHEAPSLQRGRILSNSVSYARRPMPAEHLKGPPYGRWASTYSNSASNGVSPRTTVFAGDNEQEGAMSIRIDVQGASREADEKRKRNAGASARFRARRKDREQANNQEIDELRQQLEDATEDAQFYRHERDALVAVLHDSHEGQRHLPRPESPCRSRPTRRPRYARHYSSSAEPGSQYQEHGERGGEDRLVRRRIASAAASSYVQDAMADQTGRAQESSWYDSTAPATPLEVLQPHIYAPSARPPEGRRLSILGQEPGRSSTNNI